MTPSRLGFLISLALHGGLAGLVFWLLFKPAPLAPPPALPITLNMFAPPQAPVAAPNKTAAPEPAPPPVAVASEPAIAPEPLPTAPSSQPAPSAPQHKEPKITESKITEPKIEKPKPTHHKPTEPNLVKPKATEPKVSQTKASPNPMPPAVATSPTTMANAPANPPEPSEPVEKAATAPPAMPTSASSAAERQDLLAAYQTALAAAIEREKFYPPLARRLNQEGIVEIGFTVQADGRIVNIHLRTQAPSAALARGAMEAIARVGQFKPIPPKLGMGTMNLTISLVYKLR